MKKYTVEDIKKLGRNKKLITIIGHSGAGKDSVIGATLKTLGCPEAVSITDRAMRVGEVNGVDYHFVEKGLVHNYNLLESANYAGNTYGLTVDEVYNKLKTHDVVFVIVEINGHLEIKKQLGDMVVPIYIKVGETIEEIVEVMKKRMKERGDSEENIKKRIDNYLDGEYEAEQYCDYIIINDNYEEAIKEVEKIYYDITKIESAM